jgi:hypothetical protein
MDEGKEQNCRKRIGKEKYKSSSSSRGCGFVKKSNKSHKHAIKKGYESWENRF